MAEFLICNLEASKFTFEGITFERLEGYEEGRRKRSSFEHYQTFRALADNDLMVKPLIHPGGILAVIDDVCLLLSLAQSRHVYCPHYEIGGQRTYRSVFIKGKPEGSKIILESKLESYLSTAAKTIRRAGWMESTGFIPALYFVIDRNYPEVVEFEFISAWIALEILARAYCKERGISTILKNKTFSKMIRPAVRQAISQIEETGLLEKQKNLLSQNISMLNNVAIRNLITELRAEYKMDFISDKLVDEYIKVRNSLMHSGIYGQVQRERVGELSIRLEASARLALISLLGCADCVWDASGLKVWITGEKY
jgi:hypothetical protein